MGARFKKEGYALPDLSVLQPFSTTFRTPPLQIYPFIMGNQVSELIKSVDKADEKEKLAKEQLELLMKLADARLDTFEEKLNRMFLDGECMCTSSS
jgi:hypothetical protein